MFIPSALIPVEPYGHRGVRFQQAYIPVGMLVKNLFFPPSEAGITTEGRWICDIKQNPVKNALHLPTDCGTGAIALPSRRQGKAPAHTNRRHTSWYRSRVPLLAAQQQSIHNENSHENHHEPRRYPHPIVGHCPSINLAQQLRLGGVNEILQTGRRDQRQFLSPL